MSFEYKAPFNEVLGVIFFVVRYEFAFKKRSQSEFSEDIGFNRRLLSKYELGTSNISYATFIYLMECNQIDALAAHKIFKQIIQLLARRKIYVYLNLDNVALNNLEEETLEKEYVKNSYVYIYNWLGLRYDINVMSYDEFQNLPVLSYKEIDEAVQSSMKFGRLRAISRNDRKNLKKERIELLENNIKELEKDILKEIRNYKDGNVNERIANYLENIEELEKEIEKVNSIDNEYLSYSD